MASSLPPLNRFRRLSDGPWRSSSRVFVRSCRRFDLPRRCCCLLRENRQLIRFPVYGAAAMIPLAIITLGPGLYLIDDGQIALQVIQKKQRFLGHLPICQLGKSSGVKVFV